MSQERVELWSNDSLTEFAIKFNSAIVVNSSNNPNAIVKMIDECPYKEGYEVGWRYTLSQWVVYFLANKYAVLINSKISIQKEFNIRDEDDNEIHSSCLVIKVKNKPPLKPGLKCHFCNLKYCLEEEREQHEEFWHSNKIKM
jgi:hypothetical protein